MSNRKFQSFLLVFNSFIEADFINQKEVHIQFIEFDELRHMCTLEILAP